MKEKDEPRDLFDYLNTFSNEAFAPKMKNYREIMKGLNEGAPQKEGLTRSEWIQKHMIPAE